MRDDPIDERQWRERQWRQAYYFRLEHVSPIVGNNPFNPLGPLGGLTPTPSTPIGCTTPQPPPDIQAQACPAGQAGLIVQARTYACVGTTLSLLRLALTRRLQAAECNQSQSWIPGAG